ncbi:MAG TPA: DHHA1 domain-containing protein, partial [Acidimicrobiales bacterium]|nr:DHHA1 domain-containing protein [Acidimicrobiales bacterium]
DALERLIADRRHLEEQLKSQAQAGLASIAQALVEAASDGAIAARRDGLDPGALRELALAVRERTGAPVGIIGSPDGAKVALVVATLPGGALDARVVAGAIAKMVGGGGGGSPELATAGGRDVSEIDAAAERLGALLADA